MLTKKQKKIFGGIILLIGIILVSPIPDFFDTIGFSLFSMWKGVDVNVNNIGTHFLDYTIFSILLGAVFIILGLNLLGQNGRYLVKKLSIGKYKIAVGIAIFVVLVVAIWDIWSMNSGLFGSVTDYTLGNYAAGWWNLFYRFVIILFLAVPVSYYFLVHKDKSEVLGIFGASMIMYFGGLADIAYFIFQKIPIPETLPWLMSNPFIKFVSTSLGYVTVTNISLLVSVMIGFVITFIYVKILKEKF